MLTQKRLESVLKRKYGIAVGAVSLGELRRKIDKISRTKIKISGRSYRTGMKKSINIPLKDFL